MKCLMDVAKGVVKLCEVDMPAKCGEKEILIKNICSGMSNGTERNILMQQNYYSQYPISFNYQPVGEVVECGKYVSRFQPGDKIYAGTFPGYVEYHKIREDDLAVRIPDEVDLGESALLGIAGVAFHNAMRARITEEDNVLIMGAGLLGQCAVQIVRALGARAAIADINAERLHYAAQVGVDAVYDISKESDRKAMEDRAPYTAVFEMTGVQSVVDTIIGTGFGAKTLLGRNSRVVIIAGRESVHYSYNAAQMNEITVIHTDHFTQPDLDSALELLKKGKLKIKPLITRVVPIDEAAGVFEVLRDNPTRLFGTIIQY